MQKITVGLERHLVRVASSTDAALLHEPFTPLAKRGGKTQRI